MAIQNQDIYAHTITTFNQMLASESDDQGVINDLMRKVLAEAASLQPKQLRYVRKKLLALQNLPTSSINSPTYALSIFSGSIPITQTNWIEKLNIKIGELERLPELPLDLWSEIGLYVSCKDNRSLLSTQKRQLTQQKKLFIRGLVNQDKPLNADQIEKIIRRFPELKVEVKSLAIAGDFAKKMGEFVHANFPNLEELCIFNSGNKKDSVCFIRSTLHPNIKSLILRKWASVNIITLPPNLKNLKVKSGTIRTHDPSIKLEQLEIWPGPTYKGGFPMADRIICHVKLTRSSILAWEFFRHRADAPKHYKIRLLESYVPTIQALKQKVLDYLPRVTTANEVTFIYRRANEKTDTIEKLKIPKSDLASKAIAK